LLEWKKWNNEKKSVQWGSFYATSNVKSVHVWLVANSYLSLLHYSVPQNMTEYCEKCVVTHICSMGFL
jgi:hypothetical protein